MLEAWSWSVFGECFSCSEYADYGCLPDTMYVLGLKVIAMGDLNAPDIAHTTHLHLLQSVGLLGDEVRLEYGFPIPNSDNFQRLYIDDVVVVQVVSGGGAARCCADRAAIAASHQMYEVATLPRSREKAFG